jgi:hypothetical protein
MILPAELITIYLCKTGAYAVYAASIEVQLAGILATNTRAWAQSFFN